MKLFKNINLDKLKSGLAKTRDNIFNKVNELVTGKAVIDEETLEEIEAILISGDIGYKTVDNIISNVRTNLKSEKDRSVENVKEFIKNELKSIITIGAGSNGIEEDISKYKPYVILIVGVNGAGKTTSIGKLAYNFKNAGLNVIIGSADTFRAAANEQLDVWAKRAGVKIVEKTSDDPSAVAFDTINIARKENADVVIIDTAGRLHTKLNLMDELKKIKKVISGQLSYAPNEIILVVDGTTGQNALIQANEFEKYTELTGIIITKLDGTAKGGVVFQICSEKKIPVKYIGVGEGINDLQTFEPEAFVNAIFNN